MLAPSAPDVRLLSVGKSLGQEDADWLGNVKLGSAGIEFRFINDVNLDVLAELPTHADSVTPLDPCDSLISFDQGGSDHVLACSCEILGWPVAQAAGIGSANWPEDLRRVVMMAFSMRDDGETRGQSRCTTVDMG